MSGALKGVPFAPDPVFRFEVPQHCPRVPDELLQPRDTWDDPVAYDAKARELATLFADNFAEYAGHATPEVRAAGPVVR
jgi:phosphoenolpyruvate carboxykinase (ATP)